MTFRLSLLTVALAVSSVATAQNFSQTVFFGDSLSDTGRIKEIVTTANPTLGNLLQKSFTTNPDPVWTEVLAASYGASAIAATTANPTGTNYTVGAAQAGTEAAWQGITIPSTQTQIASYLATTQGIADPNALYAVWIGSNDLFAASQATSTSAAQTAITNSVGRAATDIVTLATVGAKYILVPNIPDLSLTPLVLSQNNATLTTSAKQAAQLYNAGLFNALNGQSANVIPANTFALLQEAAANPTGFGFTNVTGVACPNVTGIPATSSSLVCTNANLNAGTSGETYLFADAIHPAGRTHRILAQYYKSIIEAPAQLAVATQGLVQNGVRTQQLINRRMDQLTAAQNGWWIDGDVSHQTTPSTESKNVDPRVSVGAEIATGQHHHTGVMAHYQQQRLETSASPVTAEQRQIGLGLYHRYQQNQVRLNLQAGVDHLTVETQRQVQWEGEQRQHQAEATGQRVYAAARGYYDVTQGKVNVAPYVGVSAQRVQVGDLLESNATQSTALRIHEQTLKSLQAEAGVQFDVKVNDTVNAFANIGYAKEFEDANTHITASLPSVAQYKKGFTMPIAAQQDDDRVQLEVGANAKLSNKVQLNAGVTANLYNSDQRDIGGFVGVHGHF
ncbi:MAG: autotransporter domain-containing protein [Acinetobacter sp.]|nr:autotransporter domain-containing protein [Acinetobacter sp.]